MNASCPYVVVKTSPHLSIDDDICIQDSTVGALARFYTDKTTQKEYAIPFANLAKMSFRSSK